jgi:ketosteroid isomerase-like protein
MDEQVRELAQGWARAELQGDVDFLARTLTDDFVGVGPRGFTLTKEGWLARHRTGDLRHSSFSLDEVAVRLYADAAVLVGRQTQRAKYREQDVVGQFRATLIVVRQQGVWALAGLQLSPLAGA